MKDKPDNLNVISEDLKNNSLRHLYLLFGQEDYLIRQNKDKLLKGLISDGDTLNYSHFEGKDIQVSEIIGIAETLPFLSERRVILIEDSGFFKNKCDELTDYVASVPDYLYMIFIEDQVDKRSRLYKRVNENGRALEFTMPDEATLLKWIGSFLSKNHKSISPKNASVFLSRTGSDMGNIRNELDKLIGYTGGRSTVTLADIDAVCTVRIENKIFVMIQAVTENDQQKALDLYADLLFLKEAPLKILALMAKQFNQILFAKKMDRSGRSVKETAAALKLQDYVVRKLLACSRKYNVRQLEMIVSDYVKTEEAVKTGRISDRLAVELMIIKYSSAKNSRA